MWVWWRLSESVREGKMEGGRRKRKGKKKSLPDKKDGTLGRTAGKREVKK